MNLNKLVKTAERFVTDNSPSILTAVGVTGTIATAYLTGKASFRAAGILSNQDPFESMLEKSKRVWKEYIPATLSCGITVGCIIFANRVGTRRAAAMAAAYTITEKAFSEYKDKVVEHIGENKERKVRDEIAQDHVSDYPPCDGQIIMTGTNEVLFLESFTGRYFQSTMETVKKAQNDTNYQILSDDYASISDFYGRVGLPRTSMSEELGWNSDDKLEIEFSAAMSEDQRPCIVIDYRKHPVRNYWRQH